MCMLVGYSLEEIHVHACRSQFGGDSYMLVGYSLEEIRVHACRSQFGAWRRFIHACRSQFR